MKASELVRDAQKIIDEHGDMEIAYLSYRIKDNKFPYGRIQKASYIRYERTEEVQDQVSGEIDCPKKHWVRII